MADTPQERKELIPKFLDIIENGWASEDNPHRVSYFLYRGYRSGRMNPGAYFVMTDGKGDFYELPADNEKLTIIGNLLDQARSDAIGEVGERLLDFQDNTQDLERSTPGYSHQVVTLNNIHTVVQQLKKEAK